MSVYINDVSQLGYEMYQSNEVGYLLYLCKPVKAVAADR
jgi:hypothetical protein